MASSVQRYPGVAAEEILSENQIMLKNEGSEEFERRKVPNFLINKKIETLIFGIPFPLPGTSNSGVGSPRGPKAGGPTKSVFDDGRSAWASVLSTLKILILEKNNRI